MAPTCPFQTNVTIDPINPPEIRTLRRVLLPLKGGFVVQVGSELKNFFPHDLQGGDECCMYRSIPVVAPHMRSSILSMLSMQWRVESETERGETNTLIDQRVQCANILFVAHLSHHLE